MPQRTVREIERRIQELWEKRRRLTKAEWKELCELIFDFLNSLSFPEYRTLRHCYPELEHPDELRRHLIWDFIADKVFLPTTGERSQEGTLDHLGALAWTFYKRYLLQQIRRCKRYAPLSVDPEDPDVGASPELGEAGDRRGHIPEPPTDTPSGPDEDGGATLPDDGDTGKLRRAAVNFLGKAEDWVILYLGCHYCRAGDEQTSLCSLVQRHGIRNYAVKARRLGITRPHGGYTREAPWADTTLGQWMQSLGIEVGRIAAPEHSRTRRDSEPIARAMKILCCEALKKMKQDGRDC